MSDAGVRNGNIVRVLRGQHLPCGCLAGIYETYAGTIVMIVDEVHAGCRLQQHRVGRVTNIETDESGPWDTPRQ